MENKAHFVPLICPHNLQYYEANAHVCSDHFTKIYYILSVLDGFEPSRWTLKSNGVPKIFSSPKQKKLSEARLAKAQHRNVVEELYWKRKILMLPLHFLKLHVW